MIISAAFTTVSRVVDTLWSKVALLIKNIGVGGATNSAFRDDGPYNFLPTRYGDTTQGLFSPYGPLSGTTPPQIGGSVYFDGTGDYLATANSTTFALAGDFTFECWINPANWSATYSALFVINANPGGLYIGKNVSNFVVRAYGVSDQLQYATLPAANAWSHVAVVRSGTTLSLFYNGTRVATTTNSYNFQQSNAVIGDDGAAGANYTGSISNLRLVKGTAVYDPTQTSFTPPAAPLTAVAGTSLLTCQSSTTITDASTNSFAVARHGDARPVTDTPFGYGSVYFDGNADYLLVPSASNAVAYGTGDFTVEFWGWASAHGKFFVTGYDGSAAWNGINVGTSSSAALWWLFGSGVSAWTFERTPAYSLSLNTWHHFAVTRENGTAKLWVDGALVDSVANTTNFPASNWYVGGCGPTAGYWNTGYVSNLRVVKGTALYTSNFTPPTTPLTAVSGTSLLTCQDRGSIVDASSNAIAITRAGDTKPSSLTPFAQKDAGYWSAYFDGSGDYLTLPSSGLIALGTGDFTVEVWVNFNSSASDQVIFDFRPSGTNGSYPLCSWYGGALNWAPNAQNGAAISGGSVTVGSWYHIAIARSGTSTKMFLNGTQVGSTYTDATDYLVGSPIVGANGYLGGGGSYFNGYMSNFRIVKGTAVYTSNFTTPTAPLTAIAGTALLMLRDNRFKDSSSNNLSVTKYGDTSLSRWSPFSFDLSATVNTMSSSGSVVFTGNPDRLEISGGAPLNLPGDFTIECWVNQTTSVAYACIWSTVGTYPTTNGLRLITNGYGTGFMLGGTGTENVFPPGTESGAPLFFNGSWNHVAVVRSGSTLTMYVNGQSAGSVPSFTRSIYSDTFLVGEVSGSYFFKGYISDLRVVKGVAVYTENFTPPAEPLAAISGTSLLTCRSATSITDESSNSFYITRVGNANAVEATPLKRITTTYGGSAYFDGSGDWLQMPTSSAFTFGTLDFTMEFWIYSVSSTMWSSGNWYLFDGNVNYTRIQVYNGTMYFYPAAGNYATYNCSAMTGGQWYHIAMVRSGSTLTGYINGVSVATTTNSSNLTDNTFTIGAYSGGGGVFNAYISDFRVTKAAVYTGNFTPPTAPQTPVGGTQLMLNFDNAAIYDASGKNDLQIWGNTKTSKSAAKFGTTSLAFDSVKDWITSSSSSNFAFGTGDFTIEMWIYPLSWPSDVALYDSRGTVWGEGLVFAIEGAGILRLYTSSLGRVCDEGVQMATNTWHHVAIARQSGTIRMFRNGTQVGASASVTTSFPGNVGTSFGANPAGDGGLNGYIADYRITRGAARYTTTFTPPEATLPTTAG